jgi:hypothetical protein
LCDGLAQLLQPGDLDLSSPLGREAERGADLVQRLRGLAEPVVRPDDGALAPVQ